MPSNEPIDPEKKLPPARLRFGFNLNTGAIEEIVVEVLDPEGEYQPQANLSYVVDGVELVGGIKSMSAWKISLVADPQDPTGRTWGYSTPSYR